MFGGPLRAAASETMPGPAGLDLGGGLADQQLLRSLIETLPGTVYRARNAGYPNALGPWPLVFIAGQCNALTGFDPETLAGDGDRTFTRLIHPADRAAVEKQVAKEVGRGAAFHISYRIRHAGGGERWVWEQGRGIYDAEGLVLGMQGFVADATDGRRDEHARSEEARLAGVRLTARTFEHELRNLLAITAGYTEVLLKDPALPERSRRRAERAHSCVMEAATIIRELVDAVSLAETNWGEAHGTTLAVRSTAA